jgi:hypothetical protein
LRQTWPVHCWILHARFLYMAETREPQQDYTLDAIAAVAHQGEKRFRLIMLVALLVVVSVVAAVIVHQMNQLPGLAKLPVAVLLPRKDQGSAKDNAIRQWEGFDLAYTNNSFTESKDQHVYYFNYPLKEGDTEEIDGCDAETINSLADKNDTKAILQQMKCWYDEDGIRVFIITMSGAVRDVRQKFTEWANTLDPRDRPVLLATVVSAPEMADRKNGVFRHYIRSLDESATFATYIESMDPAPEGVGIFFVPDAYGRSAMHLLKTRLEKRKHIEVGAYSVPVFEEGEASQTRAEVEKFWQTEENVAVIIGYGSMIENTLNALRDLSLSEPVEPFPILVVSTFTEDRWRPKWKYPEECIWEDVRYVGPITHDDETEVARQGVVFQLSYLTLDRAIHCKDKRGVEDFWGCFTDAQNLSTTGKLWNPQIEFTEDGDSHIPLRLFTLVPEKNLSPDCQ